MKLMTIIGTRPDLIKMSRIIPVLDECFDHILVHTGQNYDWELNGIFFEQLEIRQPNVFLHCHKETYNAASAVACIINNVDVALAEHKPDAVLFYGDTNSIMAAYPAKRRKIPIFHLEAGNRSFDARIPEETNRKIIDHIADVNMCNSEHARRYLLAEGLPPDRTFKTGSPMLEVLTHYEKQINQSTVLSNLNLKPQDYFVVSLHREENVDNRSNFKQLLKSLNTVVAKYDKLIIFSCHPRTKKTLELPNGYPPLDKRIRFMLPLGFFDYVHLQKHALCTISDSGTITEEASILNFPAITIRQAHERPEGMDEGAVIMAGVNPDDVLKAIDITLKQEELDDTHRPIIKDYDVPQVSWKVARIIQSYTDYVNRVVWRKYL